VHGAERNFGEEEEAFVRRIGEAVVGGLGRHVREVDAFRDASV
jgi:hypothetical protein